jgi:hypothetical protein
VHLAAAADGQHHVALGAVAPQRLVERLQRTDLGVIDALETLYKTLWRDGAERDVVLTIRRGGEVHTLTVHALDRMKTLRTPQGI